MIGLGNAGCLRDILECTVSIVVIENIAVERKAARAARHRKIAIPAIGVLARLRRTGKIKLEVVGDEQIQMSVVIVIQERAAGVVAYAVLLEPGFGRNVLEAAPGAIAIEHVGSP